LSGKGKMIFGVGLALVIILFVWGRVGFYVSQLPIMAVVGILGVVLMIVGSRIDRGTEPNKAVDWQPATHPPEPEVVSVAESSAIAVDEEVMVVSPRQQQSNGWSIRDSNGVTHELGGDTVIGRKPDLRGQPDAAILLLSSADSSISSTHARLTFRSAEAFVTDLGSTNGTVLISMGGDEHDCVPHVETALSDAVAIEFGTERFSIERSAR
jgi:FHA domain